MAACFPGLGFYDLPHIRVGDATDDLADIIGDLVAATWRRQNTSEEDALWHLLFTHQSHWGQHLEDLRRYLGERFETSHRGAEPPALAAALAAALAGRRRT